MILIFPWEQGSTLNSVFADALKMYHLNTAAASVSFVTLAAALSSSNSGIYGTIRSLSALSRIGMAPKSLAKLNNNAVPQNAGIVTLLAIWFLLMVSYFFGQSKLYIALLLVSGFTGTFAWIALCWSQINFRKMIINRGYSIKDLKYATPASPYIPILAIITMLIFLMFLAFNSEAAYQMAFVIGSMCLIVPMSFYAIKTKYLNKKPTKWDSHSLDYFNRIFPKL